MATDFQTKVLDEDSKSFLLSRESPDDMPVGTVGEFVRLWEKTVHTIMLYPSTSPLPGQFRDRFHSSLELLLRERGDLGFMTTESELVHEGETVYTAPTDETNNLAFVLFLDSIREIQFKSGIIRSECDKVLGAFAEALSRESQQFSLANRFWELGLDHFDYRVVDKYFDVAPAPPATDRDLEEKRRLFFTNDSFNMIDLEDGEEGQALTETDSTDATDEDFRWEDLLDGDSGTPSDNPYKGIQRERYQQISLSLGRIDVISDSEQHAIRQSIAADATSGDCRVALDILMEILGDESASRSADGGTARFADEMASLMEKQFDSLVQHGDWTGAIHALSGVKRESRQREKSAFGRRLQQSLLRAGDRTRIWRLTEYLNENPAADLDMIRSYLELLGTPAIPRILEMLGDLELHPARKMVCGFLADAGAEATDLIGAGVFDKRWYLVRNVAMVLGQIGSERAVSFLRRAVTHDDKRVRTETVRALARIPGDSAEKELMRLIDDSESDVRRRVLRALAKRRSQVALRELEMRIDNSEFKDNPDEGIRELLTAYARIGQEDAIPRLKNIVEHNKLFGKGKWQVVQTAAVHAIASINHPIGRQTLNLLGYHKSKAIRDAAEQARRWQAKSQPQDEEEDDDA